MKVHIINYGCSANKSNAEIMLSLLEKNGHKITSEEDAELVIVNSCTVKKPTEQKVINKLRDLGLKDKKILISGCMPEVQKEMLNELFPKASLMGINAVTEVADVVNKIEQGYKLERITDIPQNLACQPKIRSNPTIDIIQISQGCNYNCYYCVVRSAKGSLYSYPLEDIIKEVQDVLASGCTEIWLTSQDSANYGTDWGIKLPALLRKLCLISGDFKIRIGMMNPASLLPIYEDLANAYSNMKIYKFLHLPVQSGSNTVLKKMNRLYTVEEFKIMYYEFKKRFPQMTFSTDIIVGYPEETEEDFKKTIELIKEIQPDIVNVSKFGVRPMTFAKKLDPLPSTVIKERSAILSELVRTINIQQNRKWVDWEGDVLISEKGVEGFIGRNFAYKPIVIHNVKLGEKVRIKVDEARLGYLIGHII